MAEGNERLRCVWIAVAALCGLELLVAAAPHSARADPPPWALAPGLSAGSDGAPRASTVPQLAYRVPPGLRDGRCRPEMFDLSAAGGLTVAAGGGFKGSTFGKGKAGLGATAIGGLVAAAIGRPTGDGIARPQEVCFSQSFEHVPDRRTIVWMDPMEGIHYAVTPTRTIKTADGRYCREYAARATVNGQAAATFGTACRQPGGSWELVN